MPDLPLFQWRHTYSDWDTIKYFIVKKTAKHFGMPEYLFNLKNLKLVAVLKTAPIDAEKFVWLDQENLIADFKRLDDIHEIILKVNYTLVDRKDATKK